MITISVTLFWLVLVCLIVGDVIALIKENPITSTFFYWNGVLITCLALLWGGR